ncbi:MAG: hypothetical protein LBH90_02245, partial [Tannerella sp.]|nr:hypothetical protein [Tannerella sp.]
MCSSTVDIGSNVKSGELFKGGITLKHRPNAIKPVKGKVPVSTFGRNPRSTRRSGFPLQVLLLPAVVVRAFRFN